MTNNLIYFEEPRVEFGFSQTAEDSRDGLTLFGPFAPATGEVRMGVIGTPDGIAAYKKFAADVNKPIFTKSVGRPFFPGFNSAFGLRWNATPTAQIQIDKSELQRKIAVDNLHERTYGLVTMYLTAIQNYIRDEERQVDLWYIIIPHDVYLHCRPKSKSKGSSVSKSRMRTYKSGQMTLFPEEDAQVAEFSKMYETDSDFHDQLKARILYDKLNVTVQIMLEETLLFKDKSGKPYNDDMKAHLLWTQCTSTYYKLGYLPWKLHDVRTGVCYVGLVFKTLQDYQQRAGFACCAAQMFLDSGDGMVFRGNVGPWKGINDKTYHIDTRSAKELISVALSSYKSKTGAYPTELFIHGRTRFTDAEWNGFNQAVAECGSDTDLVGVTIVDNDPLRLYKDNHNAKFKFGIMRGLAWIVDGENAYLWTKGFIPRTGTANHLEVAVPLRISISRGKCDIETVVRDILCLTKLNYNACIYGDGLPVTLRFSDKIGNILTALPDVNWAALPFKYYI
jgi:hypothetical protein